MAQHRPKSRLSITSIALVPVLLAAMTSSSVAQGTGLIYLEEAVYRAMARAVSPAMGTLPEGVDLSSDFPVPGDQGAQSSCVGWAVGYALKSFHERKERGWSLADRSHVFSPAFIYNQIRVMNECTAGTFIKDALELLKTGGVATLAEFPYRADQCSHRPSPTVRQNARAYVINDYRTVDVNDPVSIKAQLASGFPVVIGMNVDDAFIAIRGDVPYSTPGGEKRGAHAMVLVGYDDRRNAYKVMNSWGRVWGNGGFGWIGYDIARLQIQEAWVTQDQIGNPAPAPEVDEDGDEENDDEIDPAPVVRRPNVIANAPSVRFDVPVNGQFGVLPGIQISLGGAVQNLQGHNLTIVVRFTHNDLANTALNASPVDLVYRDAFGHVASQGSWTLGSDEVSIDGLFVQIPYAAMATMNFQATNYQAMATFRVFYDVYIDSFHVVRSNPVDMWMRW